MEKGSVLKRITDGGLGAEPPAAGGYGFRGEAPSCWAIFVSFWKKKLF